MFQHRTYAVTDGIYIVPCVKLFWLASLNRVPKYIRRHIGTGEPIDRENLLEFRLLFVGEIVSSGNRGGTVSQKHAIRRKLHPQLRRLWHTQQTLRQYAAHIGTQKYPRPEMSEQDRFDAGINYFGRNWSKGQYQLVPLVTTEHALRCSIDITLLRPEDHTYILERGDIDGQVKTLFDAFRLPKDVNEVHGDPTADEVPMFCLLEDDRLISEVRVNADQLLLLPDKAEVRANEAFAIIHVKLNHRPGRSFDNWFD
jgi:hypothetical protein